MAQIIGVRDTRQSITNENVLVRQVNEDIVLLEPNETPLVTFTIKLKKRKDVKTPRYEWLEDDYVARWAQNGTDTVNANSGSVTLTVTDGTLFVAGDLILIPVANTSSNDPEIVRVTAVATNTLTIVRGVGGSTIRSIDANAALRLLGSASEEGAAPPSAKTTTKATKITYTEIFRTAVNISKTQAASQLYGSPNGERKSEHKKKLVEHKQKLNAQALFGVASESLTGGPSGAPIRTTMGLNSVITSNKTDANASLTRKTFETFSRSVFRYGSSQKLLLAAPVIISAIHDWGNSFLMVKPTEKVFGVDINRVQTGHGDFLLARDWMLEDGVAGKNGFSGTAFAIDVDSLGYVYLNNNGENRDTRILMDVIKDGRDAYVDEILTEGGFWFRHEKKFGKLFNATDYTV